MALVLPIILVLASSARGQGVISEIFAGNLVDPQVGVYAWYKLEDATTSRAFLLRQAIVGEERVRFKKGWWIEMELVPEIGFPSVYKMLLTGPANKAKNIHRVIVKEDGGLLQEIKIESANDSESAIQNAQKNSLGLEQVETEAGIIDAEHFVVETPEGKTEVWISEKVRPMGIVKMISPDGTLTLTRYGEGGADALSLLPDSVSAETTEEDRAPTRNFTVRTETQDSTRKGPR
jgi:hypothetical protein